MVSGSLDHPLCKCPKKFVTYAVNLAPLLALLLTSRSSRRSYVERPPKPRMIQNARRKVKVNRRTTSALNRNTRFKDGRPCHDGTGRSSQILPWTHLEGIYMQPDVTQLVKTGSKQAQCHWTLRLSLGHPDQNMTILITPGGEGKATTRDFGGQD